MLIPDWLPLKVPRITSPLPWFGYLDVLRTPTLSLHPPRCASRPHNTPASPPAPRQIRADASAAPLGDIGGTFCLSFKPVTTPLCC
ncbi:hypothetical protein E2C01_000398 [Portunus trituberculatus]|uniref:Uncharacterized protein n=1 Tax=Portunus trituberculatus TaxID=210409 RepID=A0A5B7CGC9_PORTR|nr:hypothetical protein [Portunus trituberculatus]